MQAALDVACTGSTIWLLPQSVKEEESCLADVKVRRAGVCICTFPSVFDLLSPLLQGFLSRGGEGLSVGGTGVGMGFGGGGGWGK